MMRNKVVVEQPLRLKNRLAARLVNEASEFIDKQAKSDTPFLLVVGWVQVGQLNVHLFLQLELISKTSCCYNFLRIRLSCHAG